MYKKSVTFASAEAKRKSREIIKSFEEAMKKLKGP